MPRDNPFVGKEGYLPEIYTLGHRNPTGLTMNPANGEIWSTEFRPRGGDELNRIEAGKNYGWILVTHGQHYNGDPVVGGAEGVPGMTDPVLYWVPSTNPGNIVFYTGNELPGWRGNLLLGAMSRALVRISFRRGRQAFGPGAPTERSRPAVPRRAAKGPTVPFTCSPTSRPARCSRSRRSSPSGRIALRPFPAARARTATWR